MKNDDNLRMDVYYLGKESVTQFLAELSSVDNAHNALPVPFLNVSAVQRPHTRQVLYTTQVPYNFVFFYEVFLFNYASSFSAFLHCSFLFCFHRSLISVFNTDLWLISDYPYLILLPKCRKDQWIGQMLWCSCSNRLMKGQLLFDFWSCENAIQIDKFLFNW